MTAFEQLKSLALDYVRNGDYAVAAAGGFAVLAFVLLATSIVLSRKLKRCRNALALLIERIDLAIGTRSAGMHEAAAAVEEYADLSARLLGQPRETRSVAPTADSMSPPGDNADVDEVVGRTIKALGDLMEAVSQTKVDVDWAAFDAALSLGPRLSETQQTVGLLRDRPLRNDVVDEVVRDGAFDLPLSMPGLLRSYFPNLRALARRASEAGAAIEELLATVDISVEQIPPLASIDADNPALDPSGDRHDLRQVPVVRSKVAEARHASNDDRMALVIDCYQPGYRRGDHVLRAMKVAVFNRAEWAEPVGAG